MLLVVLQATLRTLGDAPSRSLRALAQRMGVTEAEATALVVPPEKPAPPIQPPRRLRRRDLLPFGRAVYRRLERSLWLLKAS